MMRPLMVQAPPVVMRVFQRPEGCIMGDESLGEPSDDTSRTIQHDTQRYPSTVGMVTYWLALADRL